MLSGMNLNIFTKELLFICEDSCSIYYKYFIFNCKKIYVSILFSYLITLNLNF